MEKRMLVAALAGAISIGSVHCVFADSAPDDESVAQAASSQGTDPSAPGKNWRHNRLAVMADILGLTDSQKAEIKQIFLAEKENRAPLRQKLAQGRKQLRQLTRTAPFDEAAVRSLVAGQEATRTELIVSRLRMQNRILAVLTPDQQVVAKKLRLLMHGRMGHPGGYHH
jgi:Spy/CpxP family protein refolding chaperone